MKTFSAKNNKKYNFLKAYTINDLCQTESLEPNQVQ